MCLFTLASGKMPVPVGKGECVEEWAGECGEVLGTSGKCWVMWHDGF